MGPYSSMQVPGGPLQGEHSSHSTSAESNKPECTGAAKKPLLTHEEATYLSQYGRELFEDMIQNEYKS